MSAFESVVITPSETVWSLFQFILAIWWYCKYANPARNNPTITATNLITFFKAYPIRIPTKKLPPRVAAVSPKLSTMLIILDATP